MRDSDETNELPRVLSLKDATMLVVSSVIGVGIFFTPGGVAKLLPSPAWFFGAWLAGGALALAGALANAELGAMFPRAGGNYVYLRAAYHPMAGFLVGWLSFFAIFTGTVATLAVGITQSLSFFFPIGPVLRLVIAVAVIWGTSLVNVHATKTGAALNTATGYLKVAALVGLVLLGPILGRGRMPEGAFLPVGTATLDAFGVALSPVIFSYLGWNASVFVAGEIQDPGRNLPRSLFIGLGVCTAMYLFVTATFVSALGMKDLAAAGNVGEATARVLFGPAGSALMAGLVVVSVFGCLNANVLVGPRIAFAMARDGLFFRAAARVGKTSHTPYLAILVQAFAATVLVLVFDDLRRVLDYTTFAIVLATIADTIALYVLRIREPDRARPYRAAGYPVLPMLYVLANVAIAFAMVRARPTECALGVAVLLSGVPVYVLFRKFRGSSPVRDP